MKLNLSGIINLILLGIILYLGYSFHMIKGDLQERLNKTRKELVDSSELIKESDGKYSKLIDDYASSKELSEELDSINSSLNRRVMDKEEKITALSSLVFKLKNTRDTIILETEISESSIFGDTLKFYYPNISKPLITHSLIPINKRGLISDWEFEPNKLDLVVTETSLGIFKVNIDSNPYLDVQSIKVSMLPRESSLDKNSTYYGLGLSTDMISTSLDLYYGKSWSNYIILPKLTIGRSPSVGIGVIKKVL